MHALLGAYYYIVRSMREIGRVSVRKLKGALCSEGGEKFGQGKAC